MSDPLDFREEDADPQFQVNEPASVKFMITRADKAALRARGWTDEQISLLTPQHAEKILATPASNGHDATLPDFVFFGFAEEMPDPPSSLEPNLADINAHLYALFPPEFVTDYPDAWIEIATADPTAPPDEKTGQKRTGPRSARHFSPFELDKAAAYAVRMNKQGRNIYVGVALRQGETGPSGRASKKNFLASSHSWGDFDKEGDGDRVKEALETTGVEATEFVLTGTIPHDRFQVFIRLDGKATEAELEAINEAISDRLGGTGDRVQDCDRLMRLAGTVSYPPPDKVARGYVPELTKLFVMNGRAHKADDLLRRLARGPASSPGPVPKTTPGADNFWRRVNNMALANLGAWVPAVFGDDAEYQKGTGAWRISAESLGHKGLTENLSIHPKGITDWGIDDQGEKPTDKIGRYTAINLVIEHELAGDPNSLEDATTAAFWLCEKMAIDPVSLGWDAQEAQEEAPRVPIRATPYVWVEPQDVPLRDWLYGRLLIRKFVTATIAPGGLGKSSLVTVETLSQVSGKGLLGTTPDECLRVWLINLEDPAEEATRKIQAAAKHYRLTKDDIGDRLFTDSGRDQEFVIAKMAPRNGGPALVKPVIEEVVAEILARKIDVLVIDPFVSSHTVPENDNVAQDMVIKAWAAVAERGNCAVHLIDHTRKLGPASEVTTESSRGAKAKTDAARVVRTLNRMTEEQGMNAGVENYRLYFRVYNDKSNLAPPADRSDWFELRNVDLGNGPSFEFQGSRIGSSGDMVGVAANWTWPDPLAGMTGADFEKVAAVIRGGKWRADIRAGAWVGHAVAQALGLSVSVKKEKAKIKGLIAIWLAKGSLMIVEHDDDHREPKKFIELADEAAASLDLVEVVEEEEEEED